MEIIAAFVIGCVAVAAILSPLWIGAVLWLVLTTAIAAALKIVTVR